jgi:hypothetical protein
VYYDAQVVRYNALRYLAISLSILDGTATHALLYERRRSGLIALSAP